MSALQGFKSAAERFAGALFTKSVEGFISATGRGIQVSALLAACLGCCSGQALVHEG